MFHQRCYDCQIIYTVCHVRNAFLYYLRCYVLYIIFEPVFFRFIFVTFRSQSEMYLKYGTLTVQIK